jgi:hypothetical protein
LYASGRKADAEDRLRRMIDDPASDGEHLFATDFYARKYGGRRIGSCTELLRAGVTLTVDIIFGDRVEAFYDCDIDLKDHESNGPIRFGVRSADVAADFELSIAPNAAVFAQTAGEPVQITVGKKTRSLTEYFHEEPTRFHRRQEGREARFRKQRQNPQASTKCD